MTNCLFFYSDKKITKERGHTTLLLHIVQKWNIFVQYFSNRYKMVTHKKIYIFRNAYNHSPIVLFDAMIYHKFCSSLEQAQILGKTLYIFPNCFSAPWRIFLVIVPKSAVPAQQLLRYSTDWRLLLKLWLGWLGK